MTGRSLVQGNFWIAAVVGAAVAGACSASKSSSAFDNGAGGDTSGSSSGSGASGTGSTSSGLGNGGNSLGIGGGLGSGGGMMMGCASDSKKAQLIPLDMYIMQDQSGSMSDSVPGGTKWSAVTSALAAFVQQPAAAGIGVGIQYFPLQSGGNSCPGSCAQDSDCGPPQNGPCFFGQCLGCSGGGSDSCTASDYAKPDVEIAPLPGVAGAITTSLGKHGPSTSTPTSAALQGAVDHAKAWELAHPTHTTIAVLATDGDPTECDTNLGNIEAIATAAAAGNPKILTFVIGIGSSLSALNGIAVAGGTTKAFIVDTNQNVNQQFLDAMNAIRGAALSCDFLIPLPEAGMPDFTKVNVQYTPGNGGAKEIIPNVANKAACPANSDAWYYDDPANPTKIVMCDAACTKLSQDSKGEIDVLTGCKTIIN